MPTDIATRALVVALMAPAGGAKTTIEIHAITGLPVQTIRNIYARAIQRGFEPNQCPLRVTDAMFKDTPWLLKHDKESIPYKEICFSSTNETVAKIGGQQMDTSTFVKTQFTTGQDFTSTESDWEDEEE
ncbi:hypothetical protein ACHAPI_010938 [Fusarium lateritium]